MKKREREGNHQEIKSEENCFTSNKKLRLEEVVKGIRDISQRIEKKSIPTEINSVAKINIYHESKINNRLSSEVSKYIENRLNSMSHIKQINSKFRNFIIPVLPGAFNKF